MTGRIHAVGEKTYLHGIPDFIRSKSGNRLLWGVFLFLCMCGMCTQLAYLTIAFVKDETGTRIHQKLPERMPAFTICPWFNWLKPGAGLNADDFWYLTGYFLTSKALYANRGSQIWNYAVPTPNNDSMRKVKHLLRSFNFSLERLATNLSLEVDDIFEEYGAYPSRSGASVEKLVNSQGPCYIVTSNDSVNERKAEFMGTLIRLKERHIPETEKLKAFRVYGGGIDQNGVLPSYYAGKDINWNSKTRLMVKVSQIKLYPGRRGSRCDKHGTSSDFKHCYLSWINENVCNRNDDCQVVVSRSSHREEKLYRNPCNVLDHIGENPCPLKATLSSDIDSPCAKPCSDVIYDITTYPIENTNDSSTIMSFVFDQPKVAVMFEEYPLLGTIDFMSNIGGTLGLWFGASIVATVQIIIVFWTTSVRKVEV